MSIFEFFIEYFWVFIFLIPLMYLWYRLKVNKPSQVTSMKDLALIVEFGFYGLLIFLIQRYIFNQHWFFLISIPLFIVVWSIAIYLLLAGNDIYVLESQMLGEKFYDIENREIHFARTTTQRLLVMDKTIYESKKHVGESQYSFWNGSNRIKFTDFYDEKNGVFYHPDTPQLHNISFYILKSFWLKMKKDLPTVMRENVLYTWARDYWIAYKQGVLAKKFPLFLKSLDVQHDDKPFEFPDDLETLYKMLENEQLKAITDKPDKEPSPDEAKPKDEPKAVKSEGLKDGGKSDG